MEKLKLSSKAFNEGEVLNRSQLKKVMGGDGSGGSGTGGGGSTCSATASCGSNASVSCDGYGTNGCFASDNAYVECTNSFGQTKKWLCRAV